MDTPRPTPAQPDPQLQNRIARWLELKREMEALQAKLEYARLMLKLGVGNMGGGSSNGGIAPR